MTAAVFVQPLDLIKNRMQLSGKFTASSLDVAITCEIEARRNRRLVLRHDKCSICEIIDCLCNKIFKDMFVDL